MNIHSFSLFSCFCLVFSSLVSAESTQTYRVFTSHVGSQIEAKVHSITDEHVIFETVDQEHMQVKRADLSQSDQTYLSQLLLEESSSESEKPAGDDTYEILRAQLAEAYPTNRTMKRSEAKRSLVQANKYYWDGQDYEAALKVYASIPINYAEYVDARRRAGYNIFGREWGRWKEAVIFIEDAYAVDPDNKDVLEDLGRAYLKVDRKERAIEILKRANTAPARRALKRLNEG